MGARGGYLDVVVNATAKELVASFANCNGGYGEFGVKVIDAFLLPRIPYLPAVSINL